MPRLKNQLLLSFFASTFIGIAALGLGWLPPLFNTEVNDILNFLRSNSSGIFLARVCLLIGAGMLLQNWLALGRIVLTNGQYSIAKLLPFSALPAAILFLTPPLFSRDVYSYMAQARLNLRGLSPYEYGVGWLPGWFQLGADPLWVDTPTPYGPAAIWLSSQIELITNNSPYNALLWHRSLALIGVGIGIWATTRIFETNPKFAATAVWLAWLNPLVVLHFMSAAHNDALMLGLLVAAFTFSQRNQFLRALIVLIFAAGIKPIALLAAPFLLIGKPAKSISQLIKPWSLGAVFVIFGLWLQGIVTGLGMGWITALSAPTKVRSLLSPVTAISEIFSRPLDALNLLNADFVISTMQIFGLITAIGILIFLALTPSVRTATRGAAIAFTFVVLLSPVVQPWYLLWAFALIAIAGIKRPWHLKAIVILTAIFVAYSAIEANIVLDTAITFGDYVAGGSAVLAVLLVLLASRAERELLIGNQFNAGLVADYFAADEIKNDQAKVQ